MYGRETSRLRVGRYFARHCRGKGKVSAKWAFITRQCPPLYLTPPTEVRARLKKDGFVSALKAVSLCILKQLIPQTRAGSHPGLKSEVLSTQKF